MTYVHVITIINDYKIWCVFLQDFIWPVHYSSIQPFQ